MSTLKRRPISDRLTRIGNLITEVIEHGKRFSKAERNQLLTAAALISILADELSTPEHPESSPPQS